MFYKTVEGIKNLISGYAKRWQKLKEKEAYFGLHTPPEILIEIEDIEKKIQELNAQLEKAERQHEQFIENSSNSSTVLSETLGKIERRIEELNTRLESTERRQNQFIQNTNSSSQNALSSNLIHGSVTIIISGMSNSITLEIGNYSAASNITISGMSENQIIYLPNVSHIRLIISGMSNRLYIPRDLLARTTTQNSGMANQIIAT